MRCIAFAEQGYTAELAHAFSTGAHRHGVPCEVRYAGTTYKLPRCELVWMYGLHACEHLFKAYKGLAMRVVGDLGYWREDISALPMRKRPVRISIDAQQPDAHLQLRPHPPDRFEALELEVQPVQARGEYVLVCGHDAIQAKRHGFKYGEWEQSAIEVVRGLTQRRIVLREKQNCERIEVDDVWRDPKVSIATAIRNAHAVVCLTGNVGADAILHGVPVFALSGPGAVYYADRGLDMIDRAEPLADAERIRALSDIAYWQWTPEEFESGALWAHLSEEGLIPK